MAETLALWFFLVGIGESENFDSGISAAICGEPAGPRRGPAVLGSGARGSWLPSGMSEGRDGSQPAFVSGEKKGLAAAPWPSGKGASEYWDPGLATSFSEDFLSPEINVRLCFQPRFQNFWGNRWWQPGET